MNQQSSLIRILLLFLSLVVVVGGGIFVVQEYNKVRSQQSQLQSENNILQNRISVLEDAQQYLSSYVSTAVAAVPDVNAGYYALNSIRNESDEQEVIIDNLTIKTSTAPETNKSQSELSFELNGPVDNVINFTKNIFNTLPLLSIVELSSKSSTFGSLESMLTMRTFSKSYPTQLPALNESIMPLSEEEKKVLEELSTFRKTPEAAIGTSSFNEEGIEYGKQNPFSASQSVSVVVVDSEDNIEILDE